MRNLKRALSLALASVMLLGMMVVGTGAYSDVADTDNVEAIEVLKVAGIMTGDDKGNFNPDKKVTRNEMAVVMTNLLKLDAADYKGTAPFTDVPAWAADYVDACYANGIVSGTSATTYTGDAEVKAVDAGLMVMKALGYFAFDVDFGDDYKVATIKQASKIDLYDGIDAGADATLTRNEVAQLVLNALESVVVEGEQSGNTTNITAGDVQIEVTGKTTYTEQTNKIYYNGDKDDAAEYLIEKLNGTDITKNESDKNTLGLPAIGWYEDGEKDAFVKVVDEADDVVVADATYTKGFDAYVELVDEDFEDTVTMNKVANAGDVIYFYENEDGDVVTGYVVNYTLVQIEEIDDEMTKAEKADGYSFEVKLTNGDYYYDTEFAGFDYEEDDYVLVAIDSEDEIAASEAVKIVEGEVSSTKGDTVKINGTNYDNVSGTAIAADDEVKVGLNKAGQIAIVIEKNADSKSADFIYIYNVVANDGVANEDGIDGAGTYTAYVVLADGTKAKYVIEEDSVATLKVAENEDGELTWEKFAAYSVNADDELVIEKTDLKLHNNTETMSEDAKSVTTADGKVYANSKTEFVFAAWDDDDKMVVTTNTGIKNVDFSAEVAVIYDADDKEALLVFVLFEDEGIESDAQYAVITDAEASISKVDDANVYTYAAFINGEETELTFETEQKFTDAQVIAYKIDGDYAVVEKNELVEGTVTYVGEDYFEMTVAGETVEVTDDDAEYVTITAVYDEDGLFDTYEYKKGGALKKDATGLFEINSDNEIVAGFIQKEDK